MKIIASIFLFALLLTHSRAFAGNNNLVIFSQDGNRFTVILNGLRQNEKPETNVKITGLNAANYKVTIQFENTSLGSFDQNAWLMENGNEVTNREFSYSIEQKKGGDWKLKPNSVADIPATPVDKPDQVVYVFNPYGNATPAVSSTTVTTTTTTSEQTQTVTTGVTTGSPAPQTVNTVNGPKAGTTTQQTTTTATTGGAPNTTNVNMGGGGMGINISITDGMTGTSSSTTTSTTTTTTQTSGDVQTEAQDNSTDQCYWPMTSTEFANAKASVEKQSFEDGKLKIAKQILSSNCMSVAQVKEIMALFSFEETKLDWAKFAYGKTTDPQNYYQLNDGFTYPASVDALNEYIESHKQQ